MARRGPKPKPFECPEPVFWYLVGLIASDGCLSGDGRHIVIAAEDAGFLEQLKIAANVTASVSVQKKNGRGDVHCLQVGSRALYERLLVIGLTPRKSLTLQPLRVPDAYFADFLRGIIDGDGNIRGWCHPTNGREQWVVRIVGCSQPFMAWLQDICQRLWGVTGALHARSPVSEKHHTLYTLKFGKIAAKVILTECYYPAALALERKRRLAQQCVAASVGWSKSKTASDLDRWKDRKYVHTYVRNAPPDCYAGVAQLA